MKRPRREAGGGEVALMAVITKAMGAFLILVVIMLPHYVLSVSSSKTADQAQERAEKASKEVDEIADRLKKGRLTDEEIDELLRKIEALKKELAALHDEIAQLKNELNQALAEVERLKKTNQELEEEIARLKKELEELKQKQIGPLIVALSWSECPGARISLYVQSDELTKDGLVQPGPSRAPQPIFWAGQRDGSQALFRASNVDYSYLKESGHIWTMRPDNNVSSKIRVWAILENPIVSPRARPRQCPLQGSIQTSIGSTMTFKDVISDATPIEWAGSFTKSEKGELQSFPVPILLPPIFQGKSEFNDALKPVFEGPCEGMLCSYKSLDPSQNETPAEAEPRFLEFVKSNYDISAEAAREIFALMANGVVSVDDGFRWLGIFKPPGFEKLALSNEQKTELETALPEIKTRLKKKGAPRKIEEEVLTALESGHVTLIAVRLSLDKIPDVPANSPPPPPPPPPSAN